jgi:hypothetical protein
VQKYCLHFFLFLSPYLPNQDAAQTHDEVSCYAGSGPVVASHDNYRFRTCITRAHNMTLHYVLGSRADKKKGQAVQKYRRHYPPLTSLTDADCGTPCRTTCIPCNRECGSALFSCRISISNLCAFFKLKINSNMC